MSAMITFKMLCRENRSVGDCMNNLLLRNDEGSGKVIRSVYPGNDHYEKIISSSDR